MMIRILAVTLLLVVSASVYAEACVWRLSKSPEPSKGSFYIAGSLHTLRKSDYPLPVEYETAYKGAQHLTFEMEMDPQSQMEFMQKLGPLASFADDSTLESVLSEEVYTELRKYVEGRGLQMASLNKQKPWMAGIVLTFIDLQKMGISPANGVDVHFAARAGEDGKTVNGLETVDGQIAALLAFEDIPADDMIRNCLADITQMREIMDDAIAAWKRGAGKVLDELLVQDLRDDFPKLYKTMLIDRNKRWLEKLEAKIKSGDDHLVIVGTAHLVGPDSVLNMLGKLGYEFEQVRVNTEGAALEIQGDDD